jgi:hypothetical protein
MSTKTGQPSNSPTVSYYFNPERIYVVPDMPSYDDPALESQDTANEVTKDTRFVAGYSLYSVLDPRAMSKVEWGTANILASLYGAGKEVVEELRNNARGREQNQPHGEEVTNASLLSKLEKIDISKSKANTYRVTMIIDDMAPSEHLYKKRGFRKHNVQELEDLEYGINKEGTTVDGGKRTFASVQTFTPVQTLTREQQADTVEIFDDGETW